MKESFKIPQTYEQWRHCIEVLGKIQLTPEYVAERLNVLEDRNNVERNKFANLYGQDQLARTIEWFRRVIHESSPK